MLTIPITFKETQGVRRTAEPVKMGIPFKKGVLINTEDLVLVDGNQMLVCQAKITAKWNDDSIKWILINFQVDVARNSTKTLSLKLQGNSQTITPSDSISINETDSSIEIDTGTTKFLVSKTELKPFQNIVHSGRSQLSSEQNKVILEDSNGQIKKTEIKTIDLEKNNRLHTIVRQSGLFVSESGKVFANFVSSLSFYAGKSTVKWDFKIHNPKAANHPKGLWDLGDENSIIIKRLSSQFTFPSNSTLSYKDSPNSLYESYDASGFSIYQASSGGDNWQSNNHINKDKQVELDFKGYRLYEKNHLSKEGNRTSPFINLSSDQSNITVYIKDFWQNFPKAISMDENKLILDLFPQHFKQGIELQAGESKTHTIYLNFSDNKSSLDYAYMPLSSNIPLSYYAETDALTWMPETYTESDLDLLIQAGINSEDNFFSKREKLDEYGWRNFGELFADHESLYLSKDSLDKKKSAEKESVKKEEFYISHYNNQYDPIYGFARQFILTGDIKWSSLMNDLAQHVADIDIYQTNEDREEYNGGLFWHTDHYIDASTSTHRTFSAEHLKKNPQAGGGPGSEHCYSTGLATHYFMTGEKQSKQSALLLADWMVNLFEGNGGTLEYLLKFKQKKLPILIQCLKGQKIAKFSYPFTRGTGNYITTLIDAYHLTADKSYIDRVEKIIQLSIHPRDDIELRNLSDIENTWSYTILLQSISKYMMLKISLDEFDDSFYYARDSFLHYSNWMLNNEYPYLEKPEVLEYPNHTWVAQDIRKANILSFAANFDIKQAEQYRKKSEYFVNYVVDNLKNNHTRTFTRILVVLMQNHVDYSAMKSNPKMIKATQTPDECPSYSAIGLLLNTSSELFSRLFSLSIKKEKNWLKHRLSA